MQGLPHVACVDTTAVYACFICRLSGTLLTGAIGTVAHCLRRPRSRERIARVVDVLYEQATEALTAEAGPRPEFIVIPAP